MFKILSIMMALSWALPASSGWHFGESKDLESNIEYFDYAYLLPNGEPVYYLGNTMRYKITLKNNGNRTFNNFQLQSALFWSIDAACTRWWYDGQTVSFKIGDPLPGASSSGLRPADMGKDGSTAFEVSYTFPLELCPGRGEIVLQGRHRNNSGRDEVASFRIPIGVNLKRRE